MPASDDPSSRRLIVPGADPEPTTTPRIVLPGSSDTPPDAAPDADAGSGRTASRIILPPGVAPLPDDVPEFPKLRPLILMPFADGQRELLLVQDPLGVIAGQPVLGMESFGLLQLFDGNTSLNDITAALMRESKDLRVANMVRDFVAKLDQMLMLDSPRFQAAYQALRDAYHPLEIRPSAFDGRSYPADRAPLQKFLDEHFATAEQWRSEESASAGVAAAAAATPSAGATPNATATPNAGTTPNLPRALLAPHLDPRRAGPTMARAFLELNPDVAEREPLRIVVFGTGHSLMGDMYALTRKHFDTPLGRATCDTAFVDAVAKQLGEGAYRSELAHRDEHSIEFQALYLKHRLGERRFTIVPILCGGFHALLDEGRTPREHPEFEALIQAVRGAATERGGRTVYLAGVDFSHVGPRFGDPELDERTLGEIEAIDRDAIEAALLGDADRWFRAIASHDDSTRICGFAPTYAMLRCAEPGAGRLLRYEKSTEKDGSLVSVASMVW